MIEQAAEQETVTAYSIDESWFAENSFEFDDVLRARMCESCAGRLGESLEERHTVMDPKTKRTRFDFRKTSYGADPAKVIRDDCSKKKDYITPDMATLEAIFRVYLAKDNAPMSMAQVREQLAEWCPGGGCQWLLLPIDSLERLIQNDRYYGIRPHDLATAA